MAATANATKSYDLSGGALREDLEDIIYDISPMDTIFLSRAKRGSAKSTTHEWLTDNLTAPASAASPNAQIEGDAFSATSRNVPSRLKNYTQIVSKQIEVTGTSRAVDNAGMSDLFAYHTARAGKELKRDMESMALDAVSTTAGVSASARITAGVYAWTYDTNHIKLTGQTTVTTTPVASGFAKGTGIAGSTSATAFLVTDLNLMLQQAWSMGGDTDTILCGPLVYNKISTFTGLATRFRDVGSRQQAQIINAADVYVSPFGSHQIVLSRWVRSDICYALQMDTWSFNYLRPFQTIDIAKVGDADRRLLIAEYAIVAKTPLANTKATNING
jgi:hypothetical protein